MGKVLYKIWPNGRPLEAKWLFADSVLDTLHYGSIITGSERFTYEEYSRSSNRPKGARLFTIEDGKLIVVPWSQLKPLSRREEWREGRKRHWGLPEDAEWEHTLTGQELYELEVSAFNDGLRIAENRRGGHY
jgi:hypothetical protein